MGTKVGGRGQVRYRRTAPLAILVQALALLSTFIFFQPRRAMDLLDVRRPMGMR